MIIHNQVRTLVETRYVYLQKQGKSKNTGIYYLLMGSSHFLFCQIYNILVIRKFEELDLVDMRYAQISQRKK